MSKGIVKATTLLRAIRGCLGAIAIETNEKDI